MGIKHVGMAVIAAATVSGCSVESGTQCTTAPESQWMDKAEFQAQLKSDGYTINEFVVTEGNCYEIYGMDADNNKVEIYFNPVDGNIVKSESH